MKDQTGGIGLMMYNKKDCSPGNNMSGSCLNAELIKKIGMIMNQLKKKNDKIDPINCKKNISDIHDCICKNIKNISDCNSEACILTIREIIDELGEDVEDFKDSFKPLMPDEWIKDYNIWLSTDDIENVLNQHEEADKHFYFYGAVPIDFSNCSVSNLCSIDLRKHLKKGENKIGIVFNTDPHTKKGKHWISMYIDLKGESLNGIPTMYYFDSYGRKPPSEIQALVNKVKKQSKKYNLGIKYFYNDEQFQKKESQCGMYSIHFIKEMLEGKSFKSFLNNGLSDKKMIRQRDKYFINVNK